MDQVGYIVVNSAASQVGATTCVVHVNGIRLIVIAADTVHVVDLQRPRWFQFCCRSRRRHGCGGRAGQANLLHPELEVVGANLLGVKVGQDVIKALVDKVLDQPVDVVAVLKHLDGHDGQVLVAELPQLGEQDLVLVEGHGGAGEVNVLEQEVVVERPISRADELDWD